MKMKGWGLFFFLFSSTKRLAFLLVIPNVIEFSLHVQDVSSGRCGSNKISFSSLLSLDEKLAACYGTFKEIQDFRGVCC